MESLLLLVFLGLLAALFFALLAGVVAYNRTRAVEDLARRVAQLERRLQADLTQGEASSPARALRSELSTPVELSFGPPNAAASRAPPAQPSPTPSLAPGAQHAPTPTAPQPTPEPRTQPAAPPALPLPPLPSIASAAERTSQEWERWLGVRGAAIAGGILLALAGIFLVQHSIERGWMTPAMRVGIATGVGLAAMLGSRPLWRRGYHQASDALAGAGAVILYGALWAGHSLHALLSTLPALSGMAATTAASGWIAWRRPSLMVAVFALMGGFATPLLLSLGQEHPLGLFGYLLVLDLGVVAAARRPALGKLGALGASGSLLVLAYYLVTQLRPGDELLALTFLGVTAFALALPALARAGTRAGQQSSLGPAIALLGTFPLAIYVARLEGMQPHLLPLVAFSAALQVLAGILAMRQGSTLLPTGAALGAVTLLLTRALSDGGVEPWTQLAALAVLAAIPHAFLERRQQPVAAPLAAFGLAACFAISAGKGATDPGPTLAAALLFAGLLLRQSLLLRSPGLHLAAALVPAALWLSSGVGHANTPPGPTRALQPAWTAAAVLPVLLFAWRASAERHGTRARTALAALVVAAVAMTLALDFGRDGSSVLWVQLVAFLLLLLAIAGATGLGSGLALTFAAVACAGAQAAATPAPEAIRVAWMALGLQGLSVLALALVPVLGPRKASAAVWTSSALTPWVWLLSLLGLYHTVLPLTGRAAGPVTLAACTAATWLAAARPATPDAGSDARRAGWAAAASSTLALLAVALAFQLERGLWTVAPALAALGMAWAFRRTAHPRLPGLATALLVWNTLRLGLELSVLARGQGDWPRTGWPVVHWGTYGWGLPAAAALVASTWLRRERSEPGQLRLAQACGLCGLLLLFQWLNVEVQNLFQEGPQLELVLRRLPRRDAATSIAWGLFALGLLLVGLRTRGRGLRWASLGFFLAALLKVFLVDLGNLTGLYRVASIAALALALLGVSLVYQRFVFRDAGAVAHGAVGT